MLGGPLKSVLSKILQLYNPTSNEKLVLLLFKIEKYFKAITISQCVVFIILFRKL